VTIVRGEGKREERGNILKDPAPSVDGLPVVCGECFVSKCVAFNG
jgi:hypothetical protein